MASNIIKVMMYGEMQINDLEVYFNQYGIISEIKQPYFEADPEHGYDYETYIIFKTSVAAERACRDKSNRLAAGFRVEVRLHRGQVPQPTLGKAFCPNPSGSLPNTVKISIIKGQPSRSDLECIFCQYGELCRTPIKILGREQKYAYVNYKDPENAKKAAIKVHDKSLPNGLLLYARLFKKRTLFRESSAMSVQVEPVLLQVVSASANFTKLGCQWPETWNLSGNTPNTMLFEVQCGVSEWNDVSSLFLETISQATILSIQRIQNKSLYMEYQHRRNMMQTDGKPLNEKKLFHGSGTTSPETIYASKTGFDSRHCGDDRLLGQGVYFAKKASFSNSYCFKDASGHKQMLLATVLTGETKWLDKNDPSLKLPPKHPDSSKTYDSVSAYHMGGSVMFALYTLYMAYPTHLIIFDTP